MQADEGSLSQRQEMIGLKDRINARLCDKRGKEGKDRRRDFDPMKHFTRLDIWFKIAAGEGYIGRCRAP
jgi:hypothetical protein